MLPTSPPAWRCSALTGVRGAGRGGLRRRLLGPDRRRRRARRARAGDDQARDVAGVGGEPRLADLRAGGALDRASPRRSGRSCRRSRSRCSWPRSGSCCAAARSRSRARRPRSPRRARSGATFALVVGARAVLPRRGGGRDRRGRGAGRNAAGDEWASWTGPRRSSSGAGGRHRGPPGRRLPRRRLAARRPARAGARVPGAGARLRRGGRRARDRRARRGALGRARPLRRPHLGRGPGVRARLGRSPGWSRSGSSGASASSSRATPRPPRWRRSSPAGRVAQEPYLLPPELTVDEAAAPDATLRRARWSPPALGMALSDPGAGVAVPAGAQRAARLRGGAAAREPPRARHGRLLRARRGAAVPVRRARSRSSPACCCCSRSSSAACSCWRAPSGSAARKTEP